MKKFFSFLVFSLALSSFSIANVFFSEYAEGSSNNKYMEIYNAGTETVDLSGYAYPNVSNAPSTVGEHEYWNTFDDGATIAPGDVYVICHPSSDDAILAECDETHSPLIFSDSGYEVPAVKGTYVAFPSYLKHHVDENSSDKIRVTLSGNYSVQ